MAPLASKCDTSLFQVEPHNDSLMQHGKKATMSVYCRNTPALASGLALNTGE
jgi:hypothetical protein